MVLVALVVLIARIARSVVPALALSSRIELEDGVRVAEASAGAAAEREDLQYLRLPLAVRGLSLIGGEKQAEIIAQAAVNRVLKIDLQNFRSGLALRFTSLKGILRAG